MANFNMAIEKTLAHEGGDTITNDPADRGGFTRYGISQRAYPETNIESLTESQAKHIYKRDYWDAIKGDELPSQDIAECIFDFAVNAGTRRAIKLAQKASGASADGVIGPLTIDSWNNVNTGFFKVVYALEKIKFYRDIVTRSPDQKKYIMGWINRSLEGL